MGIFTNKKKLLEWQRLLIPSANRLLMNERQLLIETQSQAQQHLKIADDCVKLVNTTVKPDVFFTRYDLLIEELNLLSHFEHYIKFSGSLPSITLSKIEKQKEVAINDLIDRSWVKVIEKANSLKTENAKINHYTKFFQNFENYKNIMTQKNIENYTQKYHLYIE